MRSLPRVGLSSCFFHNDPERKIFTGKTLLYVEQSMIQWVASGGAVVYPVPTAPPAGPGIDAWVEDLDGLVLHGGSDVAPETYGEKPLNPDWNGDRLRDLYEIELFERFSAAGKPILGICRGLQVMNVALGGSLFQDLNEQGATTQAHRDRKLYDHNLHDIKFVVGSRLADLYGEPMRRTVNSIHHQGVRAVASGLVVEATSADDGIVEAVRSAGASYAVGVQWHPEFFAGVTASGSLLDNGPLLADFLDTCRGAAPQPQGS